MKVKYKNKSSVSLTKDKIYEVLSVESGMYRIVDDTEEDYLFYPEEFEIVEE
ncbi:MAG: hypothetical protein UC961_07715 [Emergencia sp.]|nr:hypothetical protein [Emergencia sp.]